MKHSISGDRRGIGFKLAVGMSALALAAIVGLTGCAPAVPSHTTADSKPSATPTPTPAQSVAPPVVFGGNCNSILSAATVKSVTGTALALQPAALKQWPSGEGGDGASNAVAMLGGVGCDWDSPTVALPPRLIISALSATVGVHPPADTVTCAPNGTSFEGPVEECGGSTTASGYWFSWTLGQLTNISQAAALAKANALVAQLRMSAAQAGTLTSFVRPARRTQPVNCTQFATDTGLPGVLTTTGMAVLTPQTDGPTSDPVHSAGLAASKAVGESSCGWNKQPFEGDGASQPSFVVTVYPGEAWYLQIYHAAIGAHTISTIPGVADAVEVAPVPNASFQRIGTQLAMADGVDLVVFDWNAFTWSSQNTVIPKVLTALKTD